MTEKRNLALFLILILVLTIGTLIIVRYSKNPILTPLHRLNVSINALQTPKIFSSSIYGINNKSIQKLIIKTRLRFITQIKLEIQGVIFIENSDTYSFSFLAKKSAFLIIDNNAIKKDIGIYLCEGVHKIKIEFYPSRTGSHLDLLWKNNKNKKWQKVPADILFSSRAYAHSFNELKKLQNNAKRKKKLQKIGYMMVIPSSIFLVSLLIFFFKTKFSHTLYVKKDTENVKQILKKTKQSSLKRIVEIDITKGFAGLLMIIAHIDGNHVFHFGTFGAALFFLCSGMNTILFMEKNKSMKNKYFYHILFVIILFVGGYTQLVIQIGRLSPLIPGFLQFSALSILLVFLLFKLIKKTIYIGYLFPIPFILHLCFQYNYLHFLNINSIWRGFFIGSGAFSLFPWSGYFLYGIFLLELWKKKNRLFIALIITAMLSILFIFILKIPIIKFHMSLSYIFLSLFALTFIFSFVKFIKPIIKIKFFKILKDLIALTGRNSLMLVYVHYLAIFFLKPTYVSIQPMINLIFQSIIAFILTALFLTIYEQIKNNYTLFIPSLITIIIISILRYFNLFHQTSNLRIADMLIGILFAFLYVQFRGILRKFWI
jgi:hypothetical protein